MFEKSYEAGADIRAICDKDRAIALTQLDYKNYPSDATSIKKYRFDWRQDTFFITETYERQHDAAKNAIMHIGVTVSPEGSATRINLSDAYKNSGSPEGSSSTALGGIENAQQAKQFEEALLEALQAFFKLYVLNERVDPAEYIWSIGGRSYSYAV